MILHLVTDRRRLAGEVLDEEHVRRCLLLQARYAVEAGVDILQIREPGVEAFELVSLVRQIVGVAGGSGTRVIVSDRVDVALAAGASGVNLRGDSVPASAVRAMAPAGFLIGRSVHSVDQAVAAAPGVDYVLAGTVWPTPSKPSGHPVLGVSGLAAIASAVAVPVLGIGGVTLERLSELRACGVAGAAAIGLFMSSGRSRSGCRAVQLDALVASAKSV